MPRDDLSIDFVKSKRMPQPGGEALDPALILEDWMNRVANLPEEIRFLQDEIADRDRQYAECVKLIEERDGRIQKFIKAHGSHETNPREEGYRKTIVESFDKAERLADEKIALTQKMQAILDRHTRQLDMQIKQLYDRGEPGFTDPDEVPSLLRPSAANQNTSSLMGATTGSSSAAARRSASIGPSAAAAAPVAASSSVNGTLKEATTKAAAAAAALSSATGSPNTPTGPGSGRGANHALVRQTQSQQGHSASAPASPAATMILSRKTRESSAGPGSSAGQGKRGPRGANVAASLDNAPPTSSGLARHSSLGPGTPKSHHQTAAGVQRAGSAGPRATTKGAGVGGPGRKASTPAAGSGSGGGNASGTEKGPGGPGRKKGGAATTGTNTPTLKTSLSRVKRPAATKNSAASSTAESELSDAESGTDSNTSSRRGTPARGSSQANGGSGSASGAGGANGGGNGSGGTAGEKEGSSQPQVKRERDSVGGVSAGDAPNKPSGGGGSSGGPGPGSSGPGGSAAAGGGGSGGPATKHARVGKGGAVGKHGKGGAGGVPSSDDNRMDVDDDEAGDDRKYCLCQNVSFGDMVACDNEDCPFEWFHWSCVGLKSEPNGTWYCPVCTERMTKSKAGGGGAGGDGGNSGGGSGGEKAATATAAAAAGGSGSSSSNNKEKATADGAASGSSKTEAKVEKDDDAATP